MLADVCNLTRFFLFILQKILQGIACCFQGMRSCPGTQLNSKQLAEELTEKLFEELEKLGRERQKGRCKMNMILEADLFEGVTL